MSNENEPEEKAAFAALLLTERDPFKAALTLFPSNINRALRVATEWTHDPVVRAEQARIKESGGAMSLLPDKAALAADIWDKMQGPIQPNGTRMPPSPDDYTKLAKLYADVRGFIEKSAPIINNNNVIVPKVIEVHNHGTDEDWEVAAERQQQELLNVSRSRH